jgi:hypothetical protein
VHTASSFVESIGVVTHAAAWASAYGDVSEFESRLEELGVRHIRDAAVPGHPAEITIFRNLAKHGIKSTLILNEEDLAQDHRIIESELPGAVDAVEGPNEYDNDGIVDWATRLRSIQSEIWHSYREVGELRNLPILGPSLTRPNSLEELGNISSDYDFGNFHPYPGGEPPEMNISREIDQLVPYASGKPLVASETGYDDALSAPAGGNSPVSEEAAAVYVPRLFLDYYKLGIARTFLYELVDEKPDPTDANEQDHFGLLRNDWSPKPAFIALRNLITLLNEEAQTKQEVKPTNMSMTGETLGVEHLLLEKADGTRELVLWQNASVWSREKRVPLVVTNHKVSISVEGGVANATLAQPLVSTVRAPLKSEGEVIHLEVSAAPIVVEIPPAVQQSSSAPSDPPTAKVESEPPGSSPIEEPSEPSLPVVEPGEPITTLDPAPAGGGGISPAGGSASPQPQETFPAATPAASPANASRFLAEIRLRVAEALRRTCRGCGLLRIALPDAQDGNVKIALYTTAYARDASLGRGRRGSELYVGRGSATLTYAPVADLVLHLTREGSKVLGQKLVPPLIVRITFQPVGHASTSMAYPIKHPRSERKSSSVLGHR